MRYILALFVALTLNAAANLLMKIGMKSVEASGGILRDGFMAALKIVLFNKILITGLICFAANAAFYMYALQSKTLKISIAYPIMVGGGFVLIAVIARFHPALSESLTWGQKLGVIFVLVGIVLIAWQTDVSAA